MTRAEFLDKLESEGASYAFTDYGLTEKDLDPDLEGTPFWQAVKDASDAFKTADVMANRLYFA